MSWLDGDVDHHKLIGSDENLSAFLKFEREMEEKLKLTPAELEAIQAECMADDIPIEPSMATWGEDAVRRYFETGGEDRPERGKPPTPPPAKPPPPTMYQMDMWGIKRGKCNVKGGCSKNCQRFQQKTGIEKTEGLGGLAITKCSFCGCDNYHQKPDNGRRASRSSSTRTADGGCGRW